MCRWTTRGHERMMLPNAKPRESHFEGRLMHDPACRAWLSEFIDHWLKAPELAKAANGKAAVKMAAPKMFQAKPAPANGSGQRRTVSRFSAR